MKFKYISLIAVLTYPLLSTGQSPALLGSWVKTKIEMANGNIDGATSKMDSLSIRYTFKENGIAFKSLSFNLRTKLNYTVNDDIIEWSYLKTKIERLTPTNLVLVDLDNGRVTNKSVRFYFTRESELMSSTVITPDDFYISGNDTIYFQTKNVYPVFDNNDLTINPFLERDIKPYDGVGLAYATFILNTDGNISDITIQHHINKSYDESLARAILSTNGFWISPTVHGKKVKILAEIKLSYSGRLLKRRTPQGVTLSNTCKMCSQNYQKRFIAAIRYSMRNEYKKAIDQLASSLAFTEDDANLNYQGSICFMKLNDIANRNVCLDKVKKSKLSYLLDDK